MELNIKIISIIIGIVFLILVLLNIRKKVLNPSSSFFWFFLSLFLISIPFLEPVYKWIATELIGIRDARHVIYIGIIGTLLVNSFFLARKVSVLSDRIQEIISALSIIEDDIHKDSSDEE